MRGRLRARPRDREPGGGRRDCLRGYTAARREPQRRHTERRQRVVTQKQTIQMQNVRDAIVHRRCGHEQHRVADREPRQRVVAARSGVAEVVRFVDDDEAVGP